MEKKNNGVLIFLGISILLAGGFIASGLSDISNSINQEYQEDNESYRVIVQDGVIYKYDTTFGTIWKKEDKSGAKWKEIIEDEEWCLKQTGQIVE